MNCLSLKEGQKDWKLTGVQHQKGVLEKSCQVRLRLTKACLCPCVGDWCGGCLWRNVLIEVMSRGWPSTYVPALSGRRNLRCLTIALCRVSGQFFLFNVRTEISFFLWAHGRPELLRNFYILGCNSRTFMWSEPSSLCFLWLPCFHLAVHFFAGSHPGQATLGKSVKAWQMGGKTY